MSVDKDKSCATCRWLQHDKRSGYCGFYIKDEVLARLWTPEQESCKHWQKKEEKAMSEVIWEEESVKPKHYQDMIVDVIHFCHVNALDFEQGNVIKYICRYRKKGGLDDLEKAKSYIERMIQYEQERQSKRNAIVENK